MVPYLTFGNELMEGVNEMEPEDKICIEVKRLDNEIQSGVIAMRKVCGLEEVTLMHSCVVGFLYRNRDRDIYQRDIEAEFSVARSTATGILQLMEKKGYIVRLNDARDGRIKRVVLTENGLRLQQNAIVAFEKIEEEMRKGISEKELQTFFTVIRKMRANIESEHNVSVRRREQC